MQTLQGKNPASGRKQERPHFAFAYAGQNPCGCLGSLPATRNASAHSLNGFGRLMCI